MMKRMQSAPTPSTCSVGALDYDRFANELSPLVREAQAMQDSSTASQLRVLVGAMKERSRREEAVGQLERIEASLASQRWHTGAAGQVLELTCTEGVTTFEDDLPTFLNAIDFLYLWNESHAVTIAAFFTNLAEWTLAWASPADIWRAVVPPEEIAKLATAVSALTPRELRKLLEGLEDGLVYSAEEAERLSEWWGHMRKQIRLASRREQGLLIAVRTRT